MTDSGPTTGTIAWVRRQLAWARSVRFLRLLPGATSSHLYEIEAWTRAAVLIGLLEGHVELAPRALDPCLDRLVESLASAHRSDPTDVRREYGPWFDVAKVSPPTWSSRPNACFGPRSVEGARCRVNLAALFGNEAADRLLNT